MPRCSKCNRIQHSTSWEFGMSIWTCEYCGWINQEDTEIMFINLNGEMGDEEW